MERLWLLPGPTGPLWTAPRAVWLSSSTWAAGKRKPLGGCRPGRYTTSWARRNWWTCTFRWVRLGSRAKSQCHSANRCVSRPVALVGSPGRGAEYRRHRLHLEDPGNGRRRFFQQPPRASQGHSLLQGTVAPRHLSGSGKGVSVPLTCAFCLHRTGPCPSQGGAAALG